MCPEWLYLQPHLALERFDLHFDRFPERAGRAVGLPFHPAGDFKGLLIYFLMRRTVALDRLIHATSAESAERPTIAVSVTRGQGIPWPDTSDWYQA